MKNKFVIVGGGATHTPGIIASLFKKSKDLKLKQLCFYDIDEKRNAIMGELAKLYFKENASKVEISYTTVMEEAFKDADYLFVQIRPGCLKQRELDEKIPLKHGLVGQETCGLGGFSFAMRTIPAMLEIMAGVERYCPNAWVLNYSNPEAIISEAVYKTYPNLKLMCICDMPISQEFVLAEFINVPHKELLFKYFGLNHFGWFTGIYDKDAKDWLPFIKEEITIHHDKEITDGDTESKNFLNIARMMRIFPEYIPLGYLQYYFFPDEMVELSNPKFTRASFLLKERDIKVFEDALQAIHSGTTKNNPISFGIHGNYIVDIADSIINNKRERFIVNTMNNGIISNFALNAVIEVPCYVGAQGLEPISVGEIPLFYKSLMEMQKGYEKLTVEAALTGSYSKAIEAIMLNKTVPSYRQGKLVLDDLIIANKGYWVELK